MSSNLFILFSSFEVLAFSFEWSFGCFVPKSSQLLCIYISFFDGFRIVKIIKQLHQWLVRQKRALKPHCGYPLKNLACALLQLLKPFLKCHFFILRRFFFLRLAAAEERERVQEPRL